MNGRKHISLPLLLLGACLVFLVIAPLATVFVKALIINDHLDFSFAAAALSEPQNARMIRNSLLLGLAVVILSSLISIPLAYLFSRTQLGQHKIFDLLFLIPFMTPPTSRPWGGFSSCRNGDSSPRWSLPFRMGSPCSSHSGGWYWS